MRTSILRDRKTIWLATLSTCFAGWACAEQAPSFPELVRQAEQSSPRLKELEENVAAARGRAKQAAAWPNPVLSVEVEDFGGNNGYRGTSRAQTTASLSQPLEVGGQRSARSAQGRADLATAQARRIQQRADFGYELAIAYATAEAAQKRTQLLKEDLARAQEDVRSARALVQSGKEGELRAVQADAAASGALAELETAKADEIAALTHLSSLVGVSQVYTQIGASLLNAAAHTDAVTPPENTTVAAPMIATAQAERETAERRLKVEQRRAIPTPSLSIGTRRIASDDANAWVAGISVPLPLFDRNRGEIAAARAELNAADARLNATRLDADAQWRTASAQVSAAKSRLSASDQGEASAREAYRLARIGYDAGRTSLIELLITRRVLTEAQLRALDARVAGVRAVASLARLAGRVPFID